MNDVDVLKDKLYSTASRIAGSDDYQLTRRVGHAAHANHCEAVLPADDEVQLDLDSEEAWHYFQERLENLTSDLKIIHRKMHGVMSLPTYEPPTFRWWPSKSGLPNRHVTVKFPGKKFTALERLVYAFVLGDDPVRGVMNFRRVLLDIPDPFVLFKPVAEDE